MIDRSVGWSGNCVYLIRGDLLMTLPKEGVSDYRNQEGISTTIRSGVCRSIDHSSISMGIWP